jgi:tetratricopeptide (TPR) repeat protein
VEEATVLLDRAEAYDSEVEGLIELRAAIEEGPDAAKKAAQDHGGGSPRPAATSGNRTEKSPKASKTSGQAVALYLKGDVSGARAKLEKGIERAGSATTKLELQEVLGRVDRIERAFAAGNKAMDAGDLDVSLDRFESAYKDVTRLDTSGKSQRRVTIRQALADCLDERGQRAYANRDYKRAAFEWNKGRKAWSEHEGIEQGRRKLEAVAKDIYNDGVISEREGTTRGRDEARGLYEEVLDIAPPGSQYHDKARAKLEDL